MPRKPTFATPMSVKSNTSPDKTVSSVKTAVSCAFKPLKQTAITHAASCSGKTCPSAMRPTRVRMSPSDNSSPRAFRVIKSVKDGWSGKDKIFFFVIRKSYKKTEQRNKATNLETTPLPQYRLFNMNVNFILYRQKISTPKARRYHPKIRSPLFFRNRNKSEITAMPTINATAIPMMTVLPSVACSKTSPCFRNL